MLMLKRVEHILSYTTGISEWLVKVLVEEEKEEEKIEDDDE